MTDFPSQEEVARFLAVIIDGEQVSTRSKYQGDAEFWALSTSVRGDIRVTLENEDGHTIEYRWVRE